jgi:RNA polymerase sigma-70 factor, ECF subfamily
MMSVACAMTDSVITDSASEYQLIRRWTDSGDREALEAALRPHLDVGWRLARRMLISDADAEDALQTACLHVIRKARQYRGTNGLRAWFLGIVANSARMHRRRASKTVAFTGEPAEPEVPRAYDAAEIALSALQRIPEHERVAIWLHAVEGMSYGDIAKSLGRREVTVRSQFSRGLARLRQLLSDRGVVVAEAALISTLAGAQAQAAPMEAMAKALAIFAQAKPVAAHGLARVMTAAIAVMVVSGSAIAWWRHAHAVVLGRGDFTAKDSILSVALGPNDQIAFATQQHAIELWDLEKRSCLGTLSSGDKYINRLTWLPGHQRLLAHSAGTVDVWDTKQLLLTRTISYPALTCSSPALLGDHTIIASGSIGRPPQNGTPFDQDLVAIDVNTGAVESHPMEGLPGVIAVSAAADNSRIAVMCNRWMQGSLCLVILSWPACEKLHEIDLPNGVRGWYANSCWVHNDSRIVVSQLERAGIPLSLLYDANTGGLLREWHGTTVPAADGNKFITITDRECSITDLSGTLTSDPIAFSNSGDARRIGGVRCSSDGRWLAAVRGGSVPLIVDLTERRNISPTPGVHSNIPKQILHFADGTLAVDDVANVLLYEPSGTTERKIPLSFWISPATGADRLLLASTYAVDDRVAPVLWDVVTGTELRRLPEHHYVDSLWLSADGRYAATEGQYDAVLRLHDLADSRVLAELRGPENDDFGPSAMEISSVRWSADGKRIFVADAVDLEPSKTESAGDLFAQPVQRKVVNGVSQPWCLSGIRDARSGALLTRFREADGSLVGYAVQLELAEASNLISMRTSRGPGLWRADDGTFVRSVVELFSGEGNDLIATANGYLRFNYDVSLLISGNGAISVSDGTLHCRYEDGILRRASPSGTLHITIDVDGTLTIRDLRDGIPLVRRQWQVDGAGAKPALVSWDPAEDGIAIACADSVTVVQLALFGFDSGNAPTADLGNEDIDRRTRAIDSLVNSAEKGVEQLRELVNWKTATATPMIRSAIQALEALAQRSTTAAEEVLRTGVLAADATVARWAKEALIRVAAGAHARALRKTFREKPVPFTWPRVK